MRDTLPDAMCGVFARRWGRLGALTATLLTGASFPLIQVSSEARGYPRYFLVSLLFLQLLISWGLVRLFDRARHGKVLALLLLAGILAGNAAATARLLAVGRGGYQAAVQFLLAHATDDQLTVGSDHDFRNGLVLEYCFLRSGSPRRPAYFAQGQWPQAGPEWVLLHSQEASFPPRRRFEMKWAMRTGCRWFFPMPACRAGIGLCTGMETGPAVRHARASDPGGGADQVVQSWWFSSSTSSLSCW